MQGPEMRVNDFFPAMTCSCDAGPCAAGSAKNLLFPLVEKSGHGAGFMRAQSADWQSVNCVVGRLAVGQLRRRPTVGDRRATVDCVL